MSKKNRALVALLAGTLALVLTAGVAWAATVQCEEGLMVCLGTPDPDTITGTSGYDHIRGLAGADLARGMGGADMIEGGKGKDTVKGLGASDYYVYGGAGGDGIYGGYAQGGVDHVFGEDGNDYVLTNQRGYRAELDVKITKEIVNCGAGDDTVVFDKDKDEVAQNCEQRYPVAPGEQPPMIESQQAAGVAANPLE